MPPDVIPGQGRRRAAHLDFSVFSEGLSQISFLDEIMLSLAAPSPSLETLIHVQR